LPDDYGHNTINDTNMVSIDERSSSTTITTRKKLNKSPKTSKNELTIQNTENI